MCCHRATAVRRPPDVARSRPACPGRSAYRARGGGTPHLRDRHAAGAGDDGARDRPADAALTRTHAAADKGLDLVRPLRAKADGLADLAGRDLFAAAHDDVVFGAQHRVGRAIERVRNGRIAMSRARSARSGAALRSRSASAMRPSRCAASSAASSPMYRRRGSGDAGRVAGNRDCGQAGSAPPIDHGAPAKLRFVPDMRQLKRQTDLRVRDDPLMQQQEIGGDFAAVPGHALDAPPTRRAQPVNTLSHRHPEPAQRGDHPQTL